MQPNIRARANDLLRRFYAAEDPVTCREAVGGGGELAALVECMRPAIRLRLSVKEIAGEDLEDLTGETVRRFLQAAARSRVPGSERIRDSLAYALMAADSVFDEYLRRVRPAWYSLNRRLLYLLDEKRSRGLFARWRDGLRERADWLGGFARWH